MAVSLVVDELSPKFEAKAYGLARVSGFEADEEGFRNSVHAWRQRTDPGPHGVKCICNRQGYILSLVFYRCWPSACGRRVFEVHSTMTPELVDCSILQKSLETLESQAYIMGCTAVHVAQRAMPTDGSIPISDYDPQGYRMIETGLCKHLYTH